MKASSDYSQTQISRRQACIALGVVIVVSFVAAFTSVSQYKSFGADEQNYQYGSYLETQGLHAFKDYFNNVQKAVGTLWLSMPFFWIFGPTFKGLLATRIFLLALKAFATVLVYWVGVRIFKDRTTAVSAAILFSFCSLVLDASYVVGTYPGPILLSALALYSYFSNWKYRHYLTGLFCGLQVLFRLEAGLIGIVFGAFILSRSWKSAWQYSLGAVAGCLPLAIYVTKHAAWEGFYRATVLFPRIYPLGSQTIQEKIFGLLIGVRYDLAIVILLAALIVYAARSFSWRSRANWMKFDNPFLFLTTIVVVQSAFILTYPRFAFAHYITLFVIPLCLLAGYALTLFIRQREWWAQLISYSAIVVAIISSTVFFFFPLQALNDNHAIVFEEMQKHPHDTIFTAYEYVAILFERTEPIYIGKNNLEAFGRSGLDTIMYSPDLDELRENPTKYDIIYLTDYSEVNISEDSYRRICVPERPKTMIYYLASTIQRMGFEDVLQTPKNLDHFNACYNHYYVRR